MVAMAMKLETVTFLLPGYSLEAKFAAIVSDVAKPISPEGYLFSERSELRPWQAELGSVLGIDTDGGQFLPSAALDPSLNFIADTISDKFAHGLVRADPVHLKADKDNATLIPPHQLGLTADEADDILATLNNLVMDEGLEFFRQGEIQWFLAGQRASGLRSFPPSFLANRKASSFLPDGDGARDWRRLMTEAQMLLHTHPVNLQRERMRQMPVNSLWFWGGAPAPMSPETPLPIRVYTDSEEASLLANAAGAHCSELSAFSTDLTDMEDVEQLIVIDLALLHAWINSDVDTLQRRLVQINEQWLAPLSERVKRGKLSQVRIVGEDGLQGICNSETMAQNKDMTSRLKSLLQWNRMQGLFGR